MKAILTKYLGPTNTRGSRVKAYDTDGNSVIISYDSSLDSEDAHTKAAWALMRKMKWDRPGLTLECGGLKNGYAFVMVREDKK